MERIELFYCCGSCGCEFVGNWIYETSDECPRCEKSNIWPYYSEPYLNSGFGEDQERSLSLFIEEQEAKRPGWIAMKEDFDRCGIPRFEVVISFEKSYKLKTISVLIFPGDNRDSVAHALARKHQGKVFSTHELPPQFKSLALESRRLGLDL